MAEKPLSPELHADAELVYNYHHMNMPLAPADAIFCLCSLDTRVAVRSAQLYLDGMAPLLIFAGGSGRLTRERFNEAEATKFANIAKEMGVPDEAILTETRSTNTGENVTLTHQLLVKRGKGLPESFILVQKPYMERRTYATFMKQWPEKDTKISVTSPQFSFDDYPNEENPRDLVINVMLGDLIRIRDYAERGFQIPQDIPDLVWAAKDRLVAAGYAAND